ncbi:pentatricopeptide repeat-containing protein 2, mitochondrial [Apis mellifera caucasica]|uniref:Pentatricopeptide repeat-containing protein 2, mitochondrial n=1 Tax=Apis mellifera TaxID=7460 RepID=A0A7M7GLW3_APIME|nr:pentatricopeptide repeat-containing protein 2, mitochondrial [Apis mellifera]KAG6794738.1 pentatricopeptide repeat-containing protein 2, mitochondrial [Apis mellifera caucasica]KAG9429606.1 pentatricopeptide repeat-containing protein 2, mitochondrial [Apis mellifera carnica]|eukprot:XP_006560291.2 pentatricopeptide repeat-containing protein 2, mitochondrial [Apis mellifera]
MAINIRGLFNLSILQTKNIFFKSNFLKVGIRCLYTEQDLGVTTYENSRFVFRNQFMTIENTFRERMKEICEKEDGIIFTEDLKAMIHLAQANDQDMFLLNNMLKKYIQKHEHNQIGSFVFGPIVMRMFYHLNQPKYALEAFDNEYLKSSFNYRSSFRTLMCLLYKNSMFKEMKDVYNKVLNSSGVNFIGTNSVLIYAACLKENTPEALEFALNIWKKQYDIIKPSGRSYALISYLAIKNNASEIALDILSTIQRDKVMSIRSLKILAYMNMERYLQIIPILKEVVESNVIQQKYLIFADVIYELEEKLKTLDLEESIPLLDLIKEAKRLEFIQTTMTLEEFLLRPMMVRRRLSRYQDRRDRNEEQMYTRNELQNYL